MIVSRVTLPPIEPEVGMLGKEGETSIISDIDDFLLRSWPRRVEAARDKFMDTDLLGIRFAGDIVCDRGWSGWCLSAFEIVFSRDGLGEISSIASSDRTVDCSKSMELSSIGLATMGNKELEEFGMPVTYLQNIAMAR
jgi:hypothetical protein